jgi:hypothetical protein
MLPSVAQRVASLASSRPAVAAALALPKSIAHLFYATTKRLRQQFATEGSESDWSLCLRGLRFLPHVSKARQFLYLYGKIGFVRNTTTDTQ